MKSRTFTGKDGIRKGQGQQHVKIDLEKDKDKDIYSTPNIETERWFLAARNDDTRIYVFNTPSWVLIKGPEHKRSNILFKILIKIAENAQKQHSRPKMAVFQKSQATSDPCKRSKQDEDVVIG